MTKKEMLWESFKRTVKNFISAILFAAVFLTIFGSVVLLTLYLASIHFALTIIPVIIVMGATFWALEYAVMKREN